MIVGLLKDFVKARRRPKSRSIELSAWELENRTRRERFPDNPSPRVEPFYGCSRNAPWYIAAVEKNRRLEDWWAYYLDEIGRRGREFPFPLVMPDSNAAELWANTTTDTDESLTESPFAQAARLKEARERARVHGWDKLERPVSIIEA